MTVKAESEMASLWIHDYAAIPRSDIAPTWRCGILLCSVSDSVENMTSLEI
jgi:hypothetical protein